MADQNVQIWRLLQQLAKATHDVLEVEVPSNQGLPQQFLAIARLLRWHGPKTLTVIGSFINLPVERTKEILDEMITQDLLRHSFSESEPHEDTYELTAKAWSFLHIVIEAQQNRVVGAIEQVDPTLRDSLTCMLQQLIIGLIEGSESFGIVCSACWAFDPQLCIIKGSDEPCVFRDEHRAQLDPDIHEGCHDCPKWHLDQTRHGIEVKTP